VPESGGASRQTHITTRRRTLGLGRADRIAHQCLYPGRRGLASSAARSCFGRVTQCVRNPRGQPRSPISASTYFNHEPDRKALRFQTGASWYSVWGKMAQDRVFVLAAGRNPDCCRRLRSGFAIGAKSAVGHNPQEPAPQRDLRGMRGTATTPQRFAAHPRVMLRIFGHSACFGVCTQNEALSVADPAGPIAETSTPGTGPVAYSVEPPQRVLRAGPTTV
jgi:hypothetical protein